MGANLGGLITAVGVGSIVIGLAVQNAVGPVISGLLLLFEQPFGIGDWLDTKFGKGRVVEVNWRAVHIDTENGIRVIPNAAPGQRPVRQPQQDRCTVLQGEGLFRLRRRGPAGTGEGHSALGGRPTADETARRGGGSHPTGRRS